MKRRVVTASIRDGACDHCDQDEPAHGRNRQPVEGLPAELQVEPGCRDRRIRDVRKEPTTLRCVQVNGIITSEHSGDVAVSVPAKDGPDEPRTRVSSPEQEEIDASASS